LLQGTRWRNKLDCFNYNYKNLRRSDKKVL